MHLSIRVKHDSVPLFPRICLLFYYIKAYFLARKVRSWLLCMLMFKFLKDIITERSSAGSRTRETRIQSRHNTTVFSYWIITCVEIVSPEYIFYIATFLSPKLLLLSAFEHFIMFLHHHVHQTEKQVVSVLLLETTESRVPQTHPWEERLRVVDLPNLTDIKKELSEKVIHGVTLWRKLKSFSFWDGVLYH